MSETTERSYYLVESMYFEKLLRTHFMLTQSTLLFEHLLSHSDRPMFLSARKVCEVLGMDRHQLEQCLSLIHICRFSRSSRPSRFR